jgi:hypothetical protein
MNPAWGLTMGAIFGIVLGTLALIAFGWWGIPMVLIATLVGILIGDRI